MPALCYDMHASVVCVLSSSMCVASDRICAAKEDFVPCMYKGIFGA